MSSFRNIVVLMGLLLVGAVWPGGKAEAQVYYVPQVMPYYPYQLPGYSVPQYRYQYPAIPRPNMSIMGHQIYTPSQLGALNNWYANHPTMSGYEKQRWIRFWDENNRMAEEAADRRIRMTFGGLGGS